MTDNVLDWLLEKENPSVRYFTLKHLLDHSEDDRDVQTARRAIMHSEPVKKILAAQDDEGFWAKPGHGYSPKYESTDWQILFLAELGADKSNHQVKRGCEYLLAHAQAAQHGGFSAMANAVPVGAIHCLNGNLIWSLLALGYTNDDRVQRAVEWLAGAITGEDFKWWYAHTVSGPNFECGVNAKKPCAWGAVKSLRALAALPQGMRSPRVEAATRMAAEFLLSRDLAKADYPYNNRISSEWFKFGFPLSYTSDVLETMLALSEAGYATDPRLKNAIDLILSKREPDGRWRQRHTLNAKIWTNPDRGKASKWVTLRARRVLKAAGV
jgi:hypothetical protein